MFYCIFDQINEAFVRIFVLIKGLPQLVHYTAAIYFYKPVQINVNPEHSFNYKLEL